MLIAADWVVPVSRPPIRDGAVCVERGLIVAVGRAHDLHALYPEHQRRDFPGCVLMPGLVNAHTHLALTALRGVVGPMTFEEWLPRLVTALSDWGPDDYAASATLGAEACLEAGVTVVGDIVHGPESMAAAAGCGVGGVFYWELLGMTSDRLESALDRAEFPRIPGGACGARARCGLSPHATYTVGPALMAAVTTAAHDLRVPVAIHVAESTAEMQLLRDGTGPLAATAARLAVGFEAPNSGAVTYLDRLGALEGATAVHLCHVQPGEIARLAATVRGAVTCPRSNRFLHNPLPPIARLLRGGIPVGVGTDSSASNDDLDLMAEVRVLHEALPQLEPSLLIEMVTAMGAIALGVEDRFGVLEPGMQADLAVFSLDAAADPEAALVREAGRDTVRAVLAGGTWRVLDGELISPSPAAVAVAAGSAARSVAALELHDASTSPARKRSAL